MKEPEERLKMIAQ